MFEVLLREVEMDVSWGSVGMRSYLQMGDQGWLQEGMCAVYINQFENRMMELGIPRGENRTNTNPPQEPCDEEWLTRERLSISKRGKNDVNQACCCCLVAKLCLTL